MHVSIFQFIRQTQSSRNIYYRMEPPPSAPIAIGKIPVATAPPLPPLDPPQEHLRLYAFLGVPVFGFTVKVLIYHLSIIHNV